jgi:RimJ/RimL family protein N-acetyltransferase
MDEHMLPATLPRLQSDRIELRSMRDSDALALLEIYGDPLVMKYTDEKPFENLGTMSLMLQSVHNFLAEGKSLEWAIVLKDSDRAIGTCGLHSFNESVQVAEVGCLLKQSAWGNGYMTEAVNLLTIYARDVLRLRQLVADVHPSNEHAQRLFEKQGFRRDSPELWSMELTIRR